MPLDLLVDALGRIDDENDDIGVAGTAPGGFHHRGVEALLGAEHARRIDEDELAVALDGDAAHRNTRRLHLVRDDRHLGADERVDQRRLAGVGRADDGDEAAARSSRRRPMLAVHRHSCSSAPATPSRSSSARAAACSAARFEAPSPRAGAHPSMRTSEVKRGAWSGPLRLDFNVARARQTLSLRPFLQGRFGVGASTGRVRSSWLRPQAPHRPHAPSRSPRRGISRRESPPWHRRGWCPWRARRCRLRFPTGSDAAPSPTARATRAQASPRTSRL